MFDARNGLPLAIMDASFLTAIRTGAAGGVALKYLARRESRVATLFGVGPQGRTQLEAACTVLNLEKCLPSVTRIRERKPLPRKWPKDWA